MGTIQDITGELADNWPAFLYIMMISVFSIFFFRERRAERRLARQIGEAIQKDMRARFEHLESLIQQASAANGQASDRQAKRAEASFSS